MRIIPTFDEAKYGLTCFCDRAVCVQIKQFTLQGGVEKLKIFRKQIAKRFDQQALTHGVVVAVSD